MNENLFSETSIREYTPEETIKRIEGMNIVGEGKIVPKIIRIDAIDCLDVPVYLSFSKKVIGSEIDFLYSHAGKGISKEEAKCSAIFEAIERYSAKMSGNENFILSKEKEMEDYVSIEECVLSNKIELNEDMIFEWIKVKSLVSNQYKYIISNYVYFPYTSVNENIDLVLPHDTNGLAAGNTIEEAMLHGIYEVVEKDAFCIFWSNRDIYCSVDRNTLCNQDLIKLIRKLEQKKIKVIILDITTDIMIPTYAAILDCSTLGEPAFVYGSGAHIDPEIAILRAVTESIQLRASQMILLKYNPQLRFKKVEGLGKDSHDIIENLISKDASKYISGLLHENRKKVSIKNYKKHLFENISEYIQYAVDVIASRNYDVLMFDLTKEEVKIPVVRIIIPGLQPSTGLYSRISKRMKTIPEEIIKRNNL